MSAGAEPEALELCELATRVVANLEPLNRGTLAHVVAREPQIIPVLAAAVGLSQERFKTWLQARFQTAGWITIGRNRAVDLVNALDEDFSCIAVLEVQGRRTWTWADVLARTMAPRQQAGRSVQQGRDLEDAVEARIEALGLPFEPRTRFIGKASQTAPADFAIPDGAGALIVVAVKGFDSTGSKLSDATREIEQMVESKATRQFVFAVVDGQGWIRRQSDLRRIHDLWSKRVIDGLYTRRQLDDFELELMHAARRVGLL